MFGSESFWGVRIGLTKSLSSDMARLATVSPSVAV